MSGNGHLQLTSGRRVPMMVDMKQVIPAANLAAYILTGGMPASAAMGRTDVYDHLTHGQSASTWNRLPLLGTSSKIEAAGTQGVLTAVLYMQPARESGREACAGRSAGCTAACLAEGVGRMSMSGAQRARRRRHAAFYADRGRFLADLSVEIVRHHKRAVKMGKVPAIRLNGTTDLPWHRMPFTDVDGNRWPNLHAAHPDVRFYEYTKLPYRMAAKGGIPSNLHLTFSISDREDADLHALAYLRNGYGAAVVLRIDRHDVPKTFKLNADALPGHEQWGVELEYPTVDGDDHDARFLDPSGSVVVLAAKGRAKADTSGFVRDAA